MGLMWIVGALVGWFVAGRLISGPIIEGILGINTNYTNTRWYKQNG